MSNIILSVGWIAARPRPNNSAKKNDNQNDVCVSVVCCVYDGKNGKQIINNVVSQKLHYYCCYCYYGCVCAPAHIHK